jgi:iron complex outermembrane recepter protein
MRIFSRWTAKRSLQEARPLALAVGAAALMFIADATQSANPQLEEVFVTAPMHKGEAETAHPVNIIDAKALRRKLAATLGETLKQEVGVSYASFGPGVGRPVIRGQGAPRVLVLANSMPVGDASNSSADHANATEPVLAERIEVLRGPATLLYGSGAIGGVVNVIDNRVPSQLAEHPTGALEYRHGSNARANVGAARIDASLGSVAMHLDAFARRNDAVDIPGNAHRDGDGSRGEIDNTDADARSGTAGLSRIFDRGYIGLAVNRLDNEYGIPPGAHSREHAENGEHDATGEAEDVRIDLTQSRYDLRSEFRDPLRHVELVRGFLSWSDYEHTEYEGSVTGTEFGNQSLDGRVEAIHRVSQQLHGVLGLQFNNREFTALGDEAFVPSVDSRSWGLFLIEDFHLGDVTWEFGLRYNRDEHRPPDDGERRFDSWSASGSAIASIGEHQTVKLGVSATERAPAIEELFSDGVHIATGSYERGDAELEQERSLNIDLGYHFHAATIDFTLELFYNRYRHYLFQRDTGLVFNPELEMIEAGCRADSADECLPVLQWSASDARFVGVESELSYQLSQQWHATLFGDYVRAALDGAGSVPRIPPARLGVELGWTNANWDASVRVTDVHRQARTGGTGTVQGYTLLSAYLEYAFERGSATWTVFLRGDNLLDQEIRNAASFLRDIAPEAGLNVEAGVRFDF